MPMLGGHKMTTSHLFTLTDLQGPQDPRLPQSQPTQASVLTLRHGGSGPTSLSLAVEEPSD